jgi:hypothetical protein
MKTTDLFTSNRSAAKLNESLGKTFGKKINLPSFDTTQLEDARNKLRTQIHDARSQSGFNETVENEALTQAQWTLDAINAEIAERSEHIVDSDVEEGADTDQKVMKLFKDFDASANEIGAYGDPDVKKAMQLVQAGKIEDAASEIADAYSDQDGGEVYDINDMYTELVQDLLYVTGADGTTDDASAGFGNEDYAMEKAPPGAKAERMVKHIKKGYANDGKITDREKGIAYATAWKQHNKEKNESVTTGDDMTKLREGEVQQASAIVTAKTMVDRVSRWIEELSGMENDTLLQLGDSIRDEMGQEQAKAFISACAPAIASALENLKSTRDTLSTSVRSLASGEEPTDMLGAEPDMGDDMAGDDMGDAVEPDMMNTDEEPADEFGASDAATGGAEVPGREQRESINRSNSLLRVLAG